MPASTQVVIAGGGPVGLSAAVELGRRGISCVVIEPRRDVSHARPRCKTINVRTMQHLRRWGLADDLRERAPLSVEWSQDVVFCTSLTGRELSRFTGVLGLGPELDGSPELGQQAPQYLLEELLRDAVRELPSCTLMTGSSVVGMARDDAGVRVEVADETGARSQVDAEYLLGCDGPRSVTRELIGAAYTGDHALRPNFGMVFQAPGLWEHVPHGPAVHYWVINPEVPALAGPIDGVDTWWIITFGVDRETGERDALKLIDGAAGRPIGATVLSTDPWTARMQIVDRMREGRVFLAGDAAHLNPPFGGHGLNTGVGDAVDLGWKLAAVLEGWGGPGLLDSYETERRPIQERVISEATANMRVTSTELLADNLDDDDAAGELARTAAGLRIQETKRPEFHSLELVLGVRIDGSPLIVADRAMDPADVKGVVAGSILPHSWLADGRSLYDELGPGFTLLVCRDGVATDRIEQAALACGLPLTVLHHDLDEPALILVRPDQYVVWTGEKEPADPAALIDKVRGVSQVPGPGQVPEADGARGADRG